MTTVTKENSYKIRAGVISSALEVEDCLTNALGFLYQPTYEFNLIEYSRLVQEVLSELTFDKKIVLFKGFVNENLHLYDSIIIKDLNEIRLIRNQLAHRLFIDPNELVDFMTEEEKEVLLKNQYFKFTKTGKEEFTFTLDQLEGYQNLCSITILRVLMGIDKIRKVH